MSSFFSSTDSELTTDRLILRTWSADEVTAVVNGARSAYWADDFPAEGDRVIAGFISEHPDDTLGEFGHHLIIERDSGLVVGSIGLFWPPSDGILEIGYGVVDSRHGRGYATEATRAMVERALTAPGVHTVSAGVEPTNPASVRVLEKCGFQRRSVDEETIRFHITTPLAQ
ncbi:GNAT family N-acetyltransferase [Actinoallomurus sp. NPDC050550]|uniref:GNAT family N-acetyltransferase n=1 Tax=Actinoallomurus sp. NPDC050550 TaxID=3154937 RepID=UPI0033CAECA2